MKATRLILIIFIGLTNTNCENKKDVTDTDAIYIYDDFSENKFHSKESYDNHMKGIEESRKNNHTEAIAYFKLALEADADNTIILNSLAIAESRIGNYDNAISISKQVIALDSLFWDNYINLSNTYRLNGEYDKSIICANKVINSSPVKRSVMGAYCNKSFTEFDQGKFDNAINSIEKAIQLCENEETLGELRYFKSKFESELDQQKELEDLPQK